MANNSSFVRLWSADFPMGISYYYADGINRAPSYLHTNSLVEFTFVRAGRVEIRLNAEPCILQPGDIHVISPGDTYTFRSLTPDAAYIHLYFSHSLIETSTRHLFQTRFVEPLKAGQLRLPRVIRPGDRPYDKLRLEFDRLDPGKEGLEEYTMELYSIVVSLCAAIAPYCTAVGQTESTAKAPSDLVTECLNYARTHYAQPITLAQLADHVHLHPNYVCAVFKKATGISFFEHLSRYRINRAARFLRSTKDPVNEIAERCGFHSASFFCRKFAQYYGMSPSAYRKNFSREISPEFWT